MPRYKVQVDEIIVYEVIVEADDENAAGDAAETLIETTAERSQFIQQVSQREAAHVELAK